MVRDDGQYRAPRRSPVVFCLRDLPEMASQADDSRAVAAPSPFRPDRAGSRPGGERGDVMAEIDLAYLRYHWGEAYRCSRRGKRWVAVRRDNRRELSAGSGRALR